MRSRLHTASSASWIVGQQRRRYDDSARSGSLGDDVVPVLAGFSMIVGFGGARSWVKWDKLVRSSKVRGNEWYCDLTLRLRIIKKNVYCVVV